MDFDFIVFAWSDLDRIWWHSFEYFRSFEFSLGTVGFCFDKSFSNSLSLFIVFVQMLSFWPAKQVYPYVYHVITFSNLVW